MSFFEHISFTPPDPIFGLTIAFQKDPRKNKVNLGAGVYRTEELLTPVLASVKTAEIYLLNTEKNKEYLPIEGDGQFLELMGELVFGHKKWSSEKQRIAAFQTVGGTGALKIGGTFLKEEIKTSLLISTPTWPNHFGVFSSCGLHIENYPYYNIKTHRLEWKEMRACLKQAHEKTVVLLHPSCHNPTGCDLNAEEWEEICQLFKTKKLIAFFDLAYQGLGKSLEEDVSAIRLFLKEGLEILVAVSSAKNFSLYGERVGSLFIVSKTDAIANDIRSRLKQIIRTNYSNPPLHGEKIVTHILSTPALKTEWEKELTTIRERINRLRYNLYQELASRGKGELFAHLVKGNGMFGYTGLNPHQVQQLLNEFAIYMTTDGRINISGLNPNNFQYVVNAINTVT